MAQHIKFTTCPGFHNCHKIINEDKHEGSKKGLCKAITKLEEQKANLDVQQQTLSNKVGAMEKSLPMVLAFQLLNAPACDRINIINKIIPYPDPSEELANKLQKSIKKLNDDVEEYHDKIITAGIEMNELKVEISHYSSLNEELLQKIKQLENELDEDETISLNSIDSEDVECLKKIRNLGENELNTKNRIKELEKREAILREQMKQILVVKNFNDEICTCEKRNKRHLIPSDDLNGGCDCLSSTMKLLKSDEYIPNFTQQSQKSCSCHKQRFYAADHRHPIKSDFTNGRSSRSANTVDTKNGPCECCKCDISDIMLSPKLEKKSESSDKNIDSEQSFSKERESVTKLNNKEANVANDAKIKETSLNAEASLFTKMTLESEKEKDGVLHSGKEKGSSTTMETRIQNEENGKRILEENEATIPSEGENIYSQYEIDKLNDYGSKDKSKENDKNSSASNAYGNNSEVK